jgi:hypothetical protein
MSKFKKKKTKQGKQFLSLRNVHVRGAGQVVAVNFIQARIVECLRVCRWTQDTWTGSAGSSKAFCSMYESPTAFYEPLPKQILLDCLCLTEIRGRVGRVSVSLFFPPFPRIASHTGWLCDVVCARCVTMCVCGTSRTRNQEPDR